MAEMTMDIMKLIYKAFREIKKVVKTLDQNDEDVRNIGQLVDCWSQILSPLQKKPVILEDPGTRSSVNCLWETLERAQAQILADTDSNRVSAVLNAEDKGNKLRRLQQEISQKVSTVTGAMVAYGAVCAEESRQPPPQSQRTCYSRNFLKINALNTMTSSRTSRKASSFIPMLVDIQSTEESEAPLQLYRIARGSHSQIRSFSHKDDKALDVYPLELRFPFKPNKEIQCPVTLTNRTGHYVGVWITQISPQEEQFTCPSSMTIEPYSSLAMSVTMKEHRQQPQRLTCKFEVLMVVVWRKDYFEKLTSIIDGKLNMNSQGVTPQLVHILDQAEKLHGEVHRAMLTAVICDEPICPIISIQPAEDMPIISIDVHPTKPWILTSHEEGQIYIWNYQTQECMKTIQVKKEQESSSLFKQIFRCPYAHPHWVYSAKLIARKCLLALGLGSGNVHVYELTNNGTTVRKIKKFSAYDGKPVDTLAVHPSKPYLLSSSSFHGKIKLWDWDRNWVKIREFDVNIGGVRSLTFNSRDAATFACVTIDRKAKVFDLGVGDENPTNLQVWNIYVKSSSPTITLPGPHSADFLFTHSHQHYFMVSPGFSKQYISERTASRTEIWDLQKTEIVHTLCVSGNSKTRGVACHPTLPILVTTSDDGTVCLWDTRTYRLEKMVRTNYRSSTEALVFTAGTDSRTSLVVGFKSTIAIMGIKICQCQGSTSGLVVGSYF